MIVEHISLRNFTCWDTLDQPLGTGLTLLLGDNGAGKSSLVEGVCWALHGETVRGTSPERPGLLCTATVTFTHDGRRYSVERRKGAKGAGVKLLRHVEGGVAEDLSGQTATETQGRIDDLLGPWSRFAATRVFAREFMSRFGAATDKERKALLEGVLGLGRFDDVLALVRRDFHAAQSEQARVERDKAREQGKVEALVASKPEPPTVDLATCRASLVALDAKADEALTHNRGLAKLQQVASVRAFAASTEARLADQRVSDLRRRIAAALVNPASSHAGDDCPICLRPIQPSDIERVQEHRRGEAALIEVALEEALGVSLAAREENIEATLEAQTITKLRSASDAEVSACAAASRQASAVLAGAEAQAERAAEWAGQVEHSRADLATAEAASDAAEAACARLEVVADVFGLRGARVMLLGDALRRLTIEANATLAALGLPLSVDIAGTTKQKSGKEVDAISIAVTGAGGGNYQAASSGERARLDVALLLALAALLGSNGAGLMVFDEVFDALDPDGVERVAAWLDSLGLTRQVLVVSHHPDMRTSFPRGAVLRAVREGSTSRLEAA